MKDQLLIVTWFYDNQPGYLDFCYRINTLSEHYDVTLISRTDASENYSTEVKTIVVGARQSSKIDLLRYFLRIKKIVHDNQFVSVLLLGTQVSLLSLLLINVRCLIYWNVHPSQFINIKSGNFFKRIFNKIFYVSQYYSAKKCHLVMPIGESHLEDLLLNGVHQEKLKLLYMGVGDKFYRAREMKSMRSPRGNDFMTPVRVIYAGSVAVKRGRDIMLEAVKRFSESHPGKVHLTVIGADTEQFNYCKKYIEQFDLSDSIEIMGRVSGDLIPELITNSHYGICLMEDLSWSRISPPTKLFEYQAAGLPVLCSDIVTHTLYVGEGINGYIFDYSVDGLYSCLVKCCSQISEYDALVARSIIAADKFKWKSIEAYFVDLFVEAKGSYAKK